MARFGCSTRRRSLPPLFGSALQASISIQSRGLGIEDRDRVSTSTLDVYMRVCMLTPDVYYMPVYISTFTLDMNMLVCLCTIYSLREHVLRCTRVS